MEVTNNPFYVCDCYLFLFEEQVHALLRLMFVRSGRLPSFEELAIASHSALFAAKMLSERYKTNVTYIPPKTPLLFLSGTPLSECARVIAGERVGWITPYNWAPIKQLESGEVEK